METFDLDSHLQGVYSVFPEAPHQPVIGITANYEGIDATLRDRYYKQVIAAGGTPVIIPPVADADVIVNTLQHLDGLILTGGGDHNPLWMGEEPSPKLHHINRERDLAEFLLVRLAYNRQIPMLGICRGIQTLAIALGGKVEQDIRQGVKHSQDAEREEPTHSVQIVKDSILFNIYNSEKIFVNSFHHQAVSVPGNKLRCIAKSTDGIIEAVESSEYKSILGVQWHPEWLEKDGLKIFQWLTAQAAEFYQAKQLHQRILILDTHCDTPMFFPQGICFDHRDSRILVDLHKMTDGHQDATTMVAYLPQPKLGETFSSKVDFDVAGPTQYADLIFDKIEEIVSKNSQYLSIARSRALCDVPRNLTDDQMRALAARGGVAHTTLYHGFLRKEGEADIMDAIAHLEHAIDIMGIDYVGLGTDFDGDGGIRGLADSSELINFTIQLLRRRYSEQDIAKIWGGNWLRVMAQVQAVR